MTLGSLFDGAGTMPLAGALCGVEAVWASEIAKFPVKVTSKRFPGMKHLGDITKIRGNEIEPVDVIAFGSPCQDLSVAGKRTGLSGERSGLFSEAIRIIQEMREATHGKYPTFAVWENVPGAFSSHRGEDFRAVLEALCAVKDGDAVIPRPAKGKWSDAGSIVGDGYSVAWRVLDAQFWGVPQRRRRIYAVADFRGGRAGEILFEREGLQRRFAEIGSAWERTAPDTGNGVKTAGGRIYAVDNHGQDCRWTVREDGKCQTLASNMGLGGNNQPLVLGADMYNHVLTGDKTMTVTAGKADCHHVPTVTAFEQTKYDEYRETDVGATIKEKGGACAGGSETLVAGFSYLNEAKARSIGYQEDICPTQRAGVEQTILVYRRGKRRRPYVRRLTPTECARLQGFPSWWCKDVPHKDAAEYEMWGNGMALPNALYVMEGIARYGIDRANA